MKGNIQVSYVIRILAGGYLLYIAVPMLQRGINGEIESKPALFIGASIIFIVAGLFFAGTSLYSIITGKDMFTGKPVMQDTDEAEVEEEVEEEAEEDSDAETTADSNEVADTENRDTSEESAKSLRNYDNSQSADK
ncbi:MAG: hypothetical protein PHC41_09995 [Lachnospiraceae bacterium]|nr:hypothetical protein [Lachnospiraceae bacterium]MDD3616542.1 hypothetical protein [Lachnospiraceae bacterium]